MGSALRNTHLYELALIGPGMPNVVPPVYSGYRAQPGAVSADGCVPGPNGPGPCVSYDWEFIERNTTQSHDITDP